MAAAGLPSDLHILPCFNLKILLLCFSVLVKPSYVWSKLLLISARRCSTMDFYLRVFEVADVFYGESETSNFFFCLSSLVIMLFRHRILNYIGLNLCYSLQLVLLYSAVQYLMIGPSLSWVTPVSTPWWSCDARLMFLWPCFSYASVKRGLRGNEVRLILYFLPLLYLLPKCDILLWYLVFILYC